MPAADYWFDDHQIALLRTCHFRTDLRHHATDFVTADERIGRVRIAPGVVLHIAGTNTGGDRTEDYVSRAAPGHRPITDAKFFRSIEDERFHGR
jgi:hypothetical protein